MITNGIKIVAIGDSITYGYPYEPESSWFDMVAKQFSIEYMNRGVNGDTTEGMLSRFDRDVLRHKPSHVIIMGGTNDAYAGMIVNQVINNIRDMVALALKNNIIPIIGLPIPCNDLIEEKLLGDYRKEIRWFGEDNNIEIIDFYMSMVEESGIKIKSGLHCDDVHPSKAGYEIMAGVAKKVIVKSFIAARIHGYYWDEDFSCIITTLKILSEIFHYELHSQLLDAAYGLNAGRIGSQCGLVEGALMFIGIYGHQEGISTQQIADLCRNFSNEIQDKFGSVLCKELRPQGFSPNNPPHLCEDLTRCVIIFTAEFIFKKIRKY